MPVLLLIYPENKILRLDSSHQISGLLQPVAKNQISIYANRESQLNPGKVMRPFYIVGIGITFAIIIGIALTLPDRRAILQAQQAELDSQAVTLSEAIEFEIQKQITATGIIAASELAQGLLFDQDQQLDRVRKSFTPPQLMASVKEFQDFQRALRAASSLGSFSEFRKIWAFLPKQFQSAGAELDPNMSTQTQDRIIDALSQTLKNKTTTIHIPNEQTGGETLVIAPIKSDTTIHGAIISSALLDASILGWDNLAVSAQLLNKDGDAVFATDSQIPSNAVQSISNQISDGLQVQVASAKPSLFGAYIYRSITLWLVAMAAFFMWMTQRERRALATERAQDAQLKAERLSSEVKYQEHELGVVRSELEQSQSMAAAANLTLSFNKELNTPLSSIQMFSHNAAELLERGLADKAKQNILNIQKIANRLGRNLENQISLISTKPSPPQAVKLIPFLSEQGMKMTDRFPQLENAIFLRNNNALPTDIAVQVDRSRLGQVFNTVLTQACEEALSADTPRIILAISEGSNSAKIKIDYSTAQKIENELLVNFAESGEQHLLATNEKKSNELLMDQTTSQLITQNVIEAMGGRIKPSQSTIGGEAYEIEILKAA